MDNNLINSFVDIFTKYKFYNDHKLSYYRSQKNNKYSIYFNNPRYYN